MACGRFGDLLTQVISVICVACWAINAPHFTRTGLILAEHAGAVPSEAKLPVTPTDPAAESKRLMVAWIRGALYYFKTAVSPFFPRSCSFFLVKYRKREQRILRILGVKFREASWTVGEA